jgi:hypothetical protein
MAIKYVIISNWSSKNQAALIAQSSSDIVGNAQPRESLTDNKAVLKLDESHVVADMIAYDLEEVLEELDSLVWTDTPSGGGELDI